MKISLAPIALRPYRASTPDKPYYKNDISNMLRNVKKAGFDGIEMGTPSGYTHQEFRDLLDETGLACVSASGLARLDSSNLMDFKRVIEGCHILGANNIMIGRIPPEARGHDAEINKFIATLNYAGKILMEEGGIHLSFHNHAIDFFKVAGRPVFQRIIEDTDPRYVFIEPDTHWLQAGGAHVITWLKKLKGRMAVVHFKDYAIDPYSDYTYLECTHKLFAEIGQGNLNWPGIVAELLDQGIEWVSCEQDVVYKPPFEAIAISAQYLRSLGIGA